MNNESDSAVRRTLAAAWAQKYTIVLGFDLATANRQTAIPRYCFRRAGARGETHVAAKYENADEVEWQATEF